MNFQARVILNVLDETLLILVIKNNSDLVLIKIENLDYILYYLQNVYCFFLIIQVLVVIIGEFYVENYAIKNMHR